MIRNATSATFQVCPGPQQRGFLSFKFPPTRTMNTRWTWLFRSDFPTFRILVWRFHVHGPRVFSRLELGVETYCWNLLYTEWKIFHINSMSTRIQSLHVMTVSHFIGYVDACLAPQLLFVYQHICYKLFDEQPWYDGFLVVSLGPDGRTVRQQRALSWIRGLLPSTSPYDIMKDGPTSVNVNCSDTHGNTTGLSYGLPRFLMMKIPCLSRR